ncbi:MAG: VapC toxin family PIN domain ribonuclease [Acidobacteria bacterium]|nr:MAG: VapC toxin family PIN domain ribonuclease [Acidobacteriota bacterium]
MITAVDTNVLLDVFGADAKFGRASQAALRERLQVGGLVACDVVWAEVGAAFESPSDTRFAMDRISVQFNAIGQEAALAAGKAWREYRRRGGPRDRVIADFLIGGHASVGGFRLLTRDRGFYERYFDDLEVIDPSQ